VSAALNLCRAGRSTLRRIVNRPPRLRLTRLGAPKRGRRISCLASRNAQAPVDFAYVDKFSNSANVEVMTTIVKNEAVLVVPLSVRREAGIKAGD